MLLEHGGKMVLVLKSEPLRDFFVSLEGQTEAGLQLSVKINPLIWFTWIGFVIMLLGTTVALWPRRGAQAVPVTAPKESSAKGRAKPKAAVG